MFSLITFLVSTVRLSPQAGAAADRGDIDGNILSVSVIITKADDVEIKPLLTASETDPWKRELFGRLDNMRQKCGALCSINDMDAYDRWQKSSRGTTAADTIYDSHGAETTAATRTAKVPFQVPVDCDALFRDMPEIDAGDLSMPAVPPEELVPFYTLGGAIPLEIGKRYQNAYLGQKALMNKWTKQDVDARVAQARKGQLHSTYGVAKATKIRQQMIDSSIDWNGKSVLVVGSEQPWLEALALSVGFANVTTLEYGAIESTHPQIHTMTPSTFRDRYLNNTLEKFDAVLSHSSLEHSGLGRYGDALNPWGDILSLARCWCTSKPDAVLIVKRLPSCETDKVEWNAHRCYANVRWPLVTANWSPLVPDMNYSFVLPKGQRMRGGEFHFFRKIN